MIPATTLYTAEDILSMPDDDMERSIIEGELFAKDREFRDRRSGRLVARLSQLLKRWLDSQPLPHGEVLAGDQSFLLSSKPDTVLSVDVAYISLDVAAANPADAPIISGAPELAVEILSPSDTQEEISRKITSYLEHGVQSVWEVDPVFETVKVYSPDADPVMHNKTQTIPAIAGMPGFEPAVAAIFS